MQTRIVIPDTFILVDRSSQRGIRETEPTVTIVNGKGTSGTRLILASTVLKTIGFDPRAAEKLYCQLFISANTLKIVSTTQGKPGARVVTTGGYVSAREFGQLLQLPEKIRLRCKAEVIKNKSWEIWATYPKELRDHVDQLNGVAS